MAHLIALGGLVVAGLSLVFSLMFTNAALRRQNNSADTANLLEIHKRLGELWRRYRDKPDEFEFGELLNFMEILARLHNNKAFPRNTQAMVGDYLQDILEAFAKDDSAPSKIKAGLSGPDTFGELKRFSLRQNLHELAALFDHAPAKSDTRTVV